MLLRTFSRGGGLLIGLEIKVPLGLLTVVSMLETVIVYSQLEVISMLYNVEHVVSDLKGVLEGCPESLSLEDEVAVFEDFLLAC